MTETTSYKQTRSRGIYKTAAGTYRVRKMINRRKISRNFIKYADALEFRNKINV